MAISQKELDSAFAAVEAAAISQDRCPQNEPWGPLRSGVLGSAAVWCAYASDGTQIYPEQEGYVVLAEEERAKGFVRPVRRSYKHLKCGGVTTMGQTLAETYARDPGFYSGTFCCDCGTHFPVGKEGEFVWTGTDEKVGT